MFEDWKRKRLIRRALSSQESVSRRLNAIYALGDAHHTDAIAALSEIALEREGHNLARTAVGRIAGMSTPEAMRALLSIAATSAEAAPNWIFMDAIDGLSWNKHALRKTVPDASASILEIGAQILAWGGSAASRNQRAEYIRRLGKILDDIGSAEARAAIWSLEEKLQQIRSREMPALLRMVLETSVFEEAQSAVNEIAKLGTSEACSALAEIRRSPERELVHTYDKVDADFEGGHSSRIVSERRSSADLGEALLGREKALWDAAKPIN